MKVLLVLIFLAIASGSGPRLIAFNESYSVWMSSEEVSKLASLSDNFMDITDFQEPVMANPFVDPVPTKLTQQTIVNKLIPNVQVTNVKNTITTLSSYFNRYYTTQTGVQASQWIYNQMVSWSSRRPDITVQFFKNSFLVPSVIATIQGNKGEFNATRVVIGAHQDSTAGSASQKSPGADDDASGTSTVMEAFRVIAQSGFKPARTIEFHLYSGEEAGLLGSQAIASSYARSGIDVEGMLNMDMTAYGRDSEAIAIVTDYTDPSLTQFLRLLVRGYSSLSFVSEQCGYACSDHASWSRSGYRAAYPCETITASMDPYIHTAQDTIDKLNLKRSVEFVKIAIGFVVEMAKGSF